MVVSLKTLVGAHLGGASVEWIVSPFIAAFIVYEVASLPEKKWVEKFLLQSRQN